MTNPINPITIPNGISNLRFQRKKTLQSTPLSNPLTEENPGESGTVDPVISIDCSLAEVKSHEMTAQFRPNHQPALFLPQLPVSSHQCLTPTIVRHNNMH
jgi:hypothetical protein